ncbi:MAG: M23 family metallopeptidase [Fibrobacterales bacterium]|nr:M23 family metallopeptidase [Fibrobacterales bacterium]
MDQRTSYLVLRRTSGKRSLSLRIGRGTFFCARNAARILAVGGLAFALMASLVAYDTVRHAKAASRNAELKTLLAQKQLELDGLDATLAQMGRTTVLANRRFGMELPDPAVVALSVGGPVDPDSALMQAVPGARLSSRITSHVHAMKRFLSENRRQLGDIEKIAQQKLLAWRCHPSIKPCPGRITSEFGYRIHPVTGMFKQHAGMDIADAPWTPVLATADGVVAEVSNRPESFYGKLVRVDHENGYQTLYAHLASAAVKPGQFIQRHQLVGYMGSTGRVTGTHLHYEVRRDGQPVDPRRFILPPAVMVD